MGLACGVSDARGARGVLEGVPLSVSVGADGDCGRGVRESLQKSYTEKTLPDVCVTILIKKMCQTNSSRTVGISKFWI
jgi:hypothetical protein